MSDPFKAHVKVTMGEHGVPSITLNGQQMEFLIPAADGFRLEFQPSEFGPSQPIAHFKIIVTDLDVDLPDVAVEALAVTQDV